MLHLWSKHYNKHIAVHRQVLALLKMNSKIEDLLDEHKHEMALPANAAKELLDACCCMCHLQQLLYDHFGGEEVQLFNITLKTHDVIHLALHRHQVSPRLIWNFRVGSNMGVLKLLGSNCVKGLAPQDCCAKMMQHWGYGMHFQLQKVKKGSNLSASDSAAVGGRADMLAIGLLLETHKGLLSRIGLLLAT